MEVFRAARERSSQHSGAGGLWAAGARRMLLFALLLPLLVACGDEEERTPTASARAQATATTVAGSPVSSGPAASPGTGTPIAGGLRTFGELADRVNAAWAGVQSYRSVRTVSAADGASPVASPATSPSASPDAAALAAGEVTEEVIVPDRRRQVTRVGGEVVAEAIAVEGRVYVRGALARLVRPDAAMETWVEVDPAALDPATQITSLFAALAAPVATPYAALPAAVRDREATAVGTVTVEGRSCQAYHVVDTTQTGGRIDTTIALDADDLPCSIETVSGGVVGITRFVAYNLPLTIEPPANAIPAATPLSATPRTGR